MVIDNPKMNELESLVEFCRKHEKIYIYGHGINQRLISKYLYMADIKIDGFLVSEIMPDDKVNEPFDVINILSVPKFGKNKIGVILSVEEERYNEVVGNLKKIGIRNLYFMSEWNKRTIPYKMTPRSKENFWLEVNLADHCNLNCQCCDHFSPIAPPTFLDYDQYVKDIKRLAELTNNHIGIMKLQGGEPLLNERLIDYIYVTREVFPDTNIILFTDGLLLTKWGAKEGRNNLWKAVKECCIEVRITRYPIPLNINKIREQLQEYDICFTTTVPEPGKYPRVYCFSEVGDPNYFGEKHSVKHPFDLEGRQEPFRFISCYQFNESIVLRDGKIYTCPMIPYSHYFNQYFNRDLVVTEKDYIDIYKVNSFEEIAEFCTHRAPFCRYCAVQCRSSRKWEQSQHTEDEWVL